MLFVEIDNMALSGREKEIARSCKQNKLFYAITEKTDLRDLDEGRPH